MLIILYSPSPIRVLVGQYLQEEEGLEVFT